MSAPSGKWKLANIRLHANSSLQISCVISSTTAEFSFHQNWSMQLFFKQVRQAPVGLFNIHWANLGKPETKLKKKPQNATRTSKCTIHLQMHHSHPNAPFTFKCNMHLQMQHSHLQMQHALLELIHLFGLANFISPGPVCNAPNHRRQMKFVPHTWTTTVLTYRSAPSNGDSGSG